MQASNFMRRRGWIANQKIGNQESQQKASTVVIICRTGYDLIQALSKKFTRKRLVPLNDY